MAKGSLRYDNFKDSENGFDGRYLGSIACVV